MPFERPSLAQITARTKTDLQTALVGTAAFFRRSFEQNVNKALAGVSHVMHGYLAWIARQLDPRTADDDIVESVHGEPFGVFKKDPTKTQVIASADGVTDTIVPVGTVFVRADGVRYLSDYEIELQNGGSTLTLTAESAGASANCPNGTVLDIESPVLGLESTATVSGTLVAGGDRETPADYLARVIARRQNPPRGGARGDYETWALEVVGVTRAWEFPRVPRVGCVTLYAVNDKGDPITLSSPKLAEIEAHVGTLKPATCEFDALTPALFPIDADISLTPNDPGVKSAVLSELAALYARVGTPAGMTIPLSKISEAVSIAAGEVSHTLNSPSADVVVPFGSLPVSGDVTWS